MRQRPLSPSDLQASLLCGCLTHNVFPHHPLRSWLRALWWSIYLLSAFDAGYAQLAQEKLALVPYASVPLLSLPFSVRVAAVRRDAARLRSWLHLLLDARACYSESFALCAGLRVLGWNCALVIGYAWITTESSTPMHAWVAYEGEVVSDRSDISSGYLELERREAGVSCFR